jgi:hypothetical protein
MARATDCLSVGCGFESHRGRQCKEATMFKYRKLKYGMYMEQYNAIREAIKANPTKFLIEDVDLNIYTYSSPWKFNWICDVCFFNHAYGYVGTPVISHAEAYTSAVHHIETRHPEQYFPALYQD